MPLFAPFSFFEQKGPVFTQGILDIYTGASAAYSLRRLSISYTGPAIEVTRTSDSATQDIGFVGEDLDTAALSSFAGGNTCVISKWYDQSGNSDDMTGVSNTTRPTIVSSGTLITQGGLPAARFDGSNDVLTGTNNNPFSYTGGLSVIMATYKNATAYKLYETVLSAGATGAQATNDTKMANFGYPNAASVSPRPAVGTDIWKPSGIQVNGTVSTNQRHLIGFYISNWSTHRSTGLSNVRYNGSDQSTKTYGTFNPSALNTNAMKIGVIDEILATSYFAGDVQEILVWNSDKNSDRVGIEGNVNDYFGVY